MGSNPIGAWNVFFLLLLFMFAFFVVVNLSRSFVSCYNFAAFAQLIVFELLQFQIIFVVNSGPINLSAAFRATFTHSRSI